MMPSSGQPDRSSVGRAISGELLTSTDRAEEDPRSSWWRLSSWPKRLVMYPLLGCLALGDAFVFWNTLVFKFQSDTVWTFVLVSALSLAAVTACHESGRILRYRHVGQGGSYAFVTFVMILWLLLGITIAWIRANSPLGFSADIVTPGPLSLTSDSVEVAALMLILYLLTGSIALAHGYRFGDPTAELRREIERTLRNRVRRLRRTQLEQQRAQLHAGSATERAATEVEAERNGVDIMRAVRRQLEQEARTTLAENDASPEGTSAISAQPGTPREQPPADPFDNIPPEEGTPT
jgi:hypothetical protein